jgi:predicted phage tail protein
MGAGEGAAAGGGAAAAGGFSAAMAAPAFAGLTVGQVAFIGASIALGGVSALLAPNPSAPGGYESRADDRPSFLFSGVVNVSEQGVAVPLCYGLFLCGSVVISSGLEIQELMSGDPPPPPPPVPDPEQFPFDPTYGGVIFGSWDTTSGGGP